MYKSKLKEKLKTRFGDKYLEFMSDLSNVSLTHKSVVEKWKVGSSTIKQWIDVLGYTHDGRTKQLLRGHYKVAKRIRAREETGRQMIELLKRRKDMV